MMRYPVPSTVRGHLNFAGEPVPAKDAATIAVVRQGEEGIEAFLMRRQVSMAFAAGMYVFPGGGVQADDSAELPWAGPAPEYFADRFRCPPETARALVVAAARETFEETGVLLAGSDEASVVEDTGRFHEDRLALERHELSFARFLDTHDLVLRTDLLDAWAHWITPRFEPRRYDTRFFVAVLPEGQRIERVSEEADHSVWSPLSEVLATVDRGEAAMMPPTVTTCRELAVETATSVLGAAANRSIVSIEPRLVEIDGKLWLEAEGAAV